MSIFARKRSADLLDAMPRRSFADILNGVADGDPTEAATVVTDDEGKVIEVTVQSVDLTPLIVGTPRVVRSGNGPFDEHVVNLSLAIKRSQ